MWWRALYVRELKLRRQLVVKLRRRGFVSLAQLLQLSQLGRPVGVAAVGFGLEKRAE